jgi:hypothetical protein
MVGTSAMRACRMRSFSMASVSAGTVRTTRIRRREVFNFFAIVSNVQRCGASTVMRFLFATRG